MVIHGGIKNFNSYQIKRFDNFHLHIVQPIVYGNIHPKLSEQC